MFQRHAARRLVPRSEVSVAAEIYESRQLLTSNVLGTVIGGSLFLTGNADANQIEITQLAANQFKVKGLNGTTVNNQAEQVFSNVNDDFEINMLGGNDTVTIKGVVGQNLVVPDNLNVNLGSGTDNLLLSRVTVRDDAKLDGSSDADNLTLQTVRIENKDVDSSDDGLRMDLGSAGSGANIVNLTDVDVVNLGNAKLNGDNDRDFAVINDLGVARNLQVEFDDGPNIVLLDDSNVTGATLIRGGSDIDFIALSDAILGQLTVETREGNDTVNVQRGVVNGFALIDTVDGNDSVKLVDTNFNGNLTVDTGNQNDTVVLDGITVNFKKQLQVRLDDGDDSLTVDHVNAGSVMLDGGLGNDELNLVFNLSDLAEAIALAQAAVNFEDLNIDVSGILLP